MTRDCSLSGKSSRIISEEYRVPCHHAGRVPQESDNDEEKCQQKSTIYRICDLW